VGEAIPVAGRLMAVVDVYDALISKRVYKPAFPHEEAVSIIESGSGTHFDPEIVDTFLDISDQLWSIAQRYLDR
jgi:putative two-component system response regulator